MMRRFGLPILLLCVLAGAPVHADDGLHLYVPRLALDMAVSECHIVNHQYDLDHLGNGVCHLEGTATLNMTWARIVLAGHTPGGFEAIDELQEGDQIVLWDARRVESYTVQFVTTTIPRDISWLMPTPSETLTLITCAGDLRLIVHAVREG